MNKIFLVGIVVVLLVLAGVGYYMSQGNLNSLYYNQTSNGTNNPVPNTNVAPSTQTTIPPVVITPSTTITTTTTTTTVPAQPQNLSASVTIKNFSFNPSPLNIKVGTTVTWTNNDSMPHQIKSNFFNSDVLSNGQAFSFTFSAIGQYDYSCAIHPSMLGQIIVTR
jgi:plastocyanin